MCASNPHAHARRPPCFAGIIDEEKKVRHSKLADKIEEVISDPSKMEIKLKAGGGCTQHACPVLVHAPVAQRWP